MHVDKSSKCNISYQSSKTRRFEILVYSLHVPSENVILLLRLECTHIRNILSVLQSICGQFTYIVWHSVNVYTCDRIIFFTSFSFWLQSYGRIWTDTTTTVYWILPPTSYYVK